MKRFIKLLATLALAAVIGFLFIACGDDPDDGKKNGDDGPPPVAVSFTELTGNGVADTTVTSQLTLTFSEAIPGLSASDITLSGVSGVIKGAVTGSNPYTLNISHTSSFSAGGTLSVAVSKSGYAITPSPKTVTVYRLTPQWQGGTTYTANGNVSVYSDGYGYPVRCEMWTQSGTNNIITAYGEYQGGGAAFRAEWNNPNDYLGRVGWFWNNGGTHESYGELFCDFDFERSANGTGGSYSYIGVYGWARNSSAATESEKLIEYYIVDDWYGNNIMGTPYGTTKEGEGFTADDATYFIYKGTRTGSSIGPGNTFTQVFSVRQERRTSGTISISEHFDEWESRLGIELKSMYDCRFLVEAAGGIGWFDAKEIKFYTDSEPTFVSGLQSDGSFALNPAGFVEWYRGAVSGNTVTFSNGVENGGVYYDYPSSVSGFDINSFGSLKIVYTMTDLTKGSNETIEGANVTIKVYNATLGANSYWGTNAKHIKLSDQPNSILLFDDTGNKDDKTFADYFHSPDGTKGFSFTVNIQDTGAKGSEGTTDDNFKVQFHSIAFYPVGYDHDGD